MGALTRADELLAAFDELAAALATPARDRDLIRELALRAGWGARAITAPLLPSGISHGVPWELSVAIGSPELRVFVEPQADPALPRNYWRTGLDVLAFAADHGADGIARLRALTAGLIETYADHPRAPRLWFAIALPPSGPPRWHAYVTCPDTATALAALERAGCSTAHLALRPDDRITIVSLDLVVPSLARAKAYVLMRDASPYDVEGDVARFARALGGTPPQWLVAAGVGALPSCAVHVAARHLDPWTVPSRIESLLVQHDLDPAIYRRVQALGELHYVTFQRSAGHPRITVYLAPRVRR